jgi:hypothetical protein
MTTAADQIRAVLEAYWLLDLAIGEDDEERTATNMGRLDDALYHLAKSAGLYYRDVGREPTR